MKLNEILKESPPDESLKAYSDYEQSPDSPVNLEYGLIDMAGRELMAIEQDPAGYYAQRGEEIAPEQAQQIEQILASVDDRTLDLMTKSKIILRAVEANYDSESDSSYIDLASMMEVIGKVEARMAR